MTGSFQSSVVSFQKQTRFVSGSVLLSLYLSQSSVVGWQEADAGRAMRVSGYVTRDSSYGIRDLGANSIIDAWCFVLGRVSGCGFQARGGRE